MSYQVPDQHGRRFVVTGANSGTGKEAAKRLAAAGAEVVLAVRSIEKGEAAVAELRSAVPEARVEVRRLDLADLASVREFAAGIVDDGRPLHALVNNAGVMVPPKRLDHRGRVRAAARHQLPRPVRADEPPPAGAARDAGRPGRDHVERHGELRPDRLRGSRLDLPPLLAQPRVRPVEARRPAARAMARGRRGRARLGPAEHDRAPRLHPDEPADRRPQPRPGRSAAGARPPHDPPVPGRRDGAEPLLFAATSPGGRAGRLLRPEPMGARRPDAQGRPSRGPRARWRWPSGCGRRRSASPAPPSPHASPPEGSGQPAARRTSSAIRCSTSGVSSVSA